MLPSTSLATSITNNQPALKGAKLMIKRIVWTFLITGVIVISTTVSQAQSTSRRAWSRGASVNNVTPPAPDQAVEGAPVSQELQTAAQVGLLDKKTAIVGSWLGTSSEGNKVILTFNSDGTIHGTVQGAVSTIPEFGVLTSGHGLWEYLGGKQFGFTVVSVNYDINSGAYMGLLKARSLLTLNAIGDQLSGLDKVEIFGPDGELVFAVSGNTTFVRIKFEPFN